MFLRRRVFNYYDKFNFDFMQTIRLSSNFESINA